MTSYLKAEDDWPLEKEPQVTIFIHTVKKVEGVMFLKLLIFCFCTSTNCVHESFLVPVVEGGVPAVHDVAGDGRGHEGADGEREGAHQDLVPLQVRGQPVVGLALPLLGRGALAVVVPVLWKENVKSW